MGFKKYKYFLTWKDSEILLFESQFQFLAQDVCLAHYEKGLARGLFSFDRSRINQVWSELGLWGLIGRVHPTELVRILCAFGCRLKSVDLADDKITLRRSYWPVTYYLLADPNEIGRLRHIYYRPLEAGVDNYISLLLEMSDRLLLGNYYTTKDHNADEQLPQFCKLLEVDLCLATGVIQRVLSRLFFENCRLVGECASGYLTLAEKDPKIDVIRGHGLEYSLFYVGEVSKAG